MSGQHATTSKPAASPQMTREEFQVWMDYFMGATVRKSKCGKTDWTVTAGWYENAGIFSRCRVLLTRKGPYGERIKYTTNQHELRHIRD